MSDVIKFPPKGPAVSANVPLPVAPVPRSIRYRRRAAQLGRMADAEATEEKMLPLMHQALSWIQLAENEELLMREGQSPIVLVVEDESLDRMETTEMLEAAGFHAIEAANADAAISILEAHPGIDIVFTDIKMPGSMDGLKLAAAIRQRWPSIAVVATSGIAPTVDGPLPDGCRFLAKPYGPKEIIGALQEIAS